MLALFILTIANIIPLQITFADTAANVRWPTNGAHVPGTQPFKAMISGIPVEQCDMYWQVKGALNQMHNGYTTYPHKEAAVDLSGGTWHGSGPYVVTFIAKNSSCAIIARASETIYINNGAAAAPPQQPQTQHQSQPVTTTALAASTQMATPAAPLTSSSFYVDPNSKAAQQTKIWQSSYLDGSAAMQILASQPTATWFGDWNSNIQRDVRALVANAQAQGTTPIMVAYNIPQRDCGGYSAGGTNNPEGYRAWMASFAQGLGTAKAVIILEPDALAQISCLSSSDQQTRLQLISGAVSTLKADPNAAVYIDAGHSNWIDPSTMAQRLQQAGISAANGFALNVSNFMSTSDEINYGTQVSQKLGGNMHFVIDSSRNGNGSKGEWCNPSGRAIGTKPTTNTGHSLVDAFLWLKTPGESDGSCNGGPSAGTWWPEYGVQLVRNAH